MIYVFLIECSLKSYRTSQTDDVSRQLLVSSSMSVSEVFQNRDPTVYDQRQQHFYASIRIAIHLSLSIRTSIPVFK